MTAPVKTYYVPFAAGQTDANVSGGGAAGDRIDAIIVTVNTAATSVAAIGDGPGGADIPLVPANTPIGVYTLTFGPHGLRSGSAGWVATTGAGVSLLFVGELTQ